jgi:CO/xanthine dehydrogenase FAD-binding subunit
MAAGACGRFPPHRPPTPWSGEERFLTVSQPRTLDDALAARAANPDAVVVAGGTGVLVEINRGVEPTALIDLSRVAGLREAKMLGDVVALGAGVTYSDVLEHHAETLPGLAAAARTVASRQIRNRATLVGALVLADPSGDALAALGAAGAKVEIRGTRGRRTVPVDSFIVAPGICDLRSDELVTALLVPVADGPTAYAKAGARNAMARAVCGVAVALHPGRRTGSACVVGAGPSAVRPDVAEALVHASWDALEDPPTAQRFGALVAAAVDPIPDARGSVEHRRHIAGVLAARALRRAAAELT